MTLNFNDIERLGKEIAKDENLKLKSITRSPRQGTLGTCTSDGDIKIRMQMSPHMFPGIRDQENLRTLAHEISHLRYMHHDKEFWEYAAVLCEKISGKVGFIVKPERFMLR